MPCLSEQVIKGGPGPHRQDSDKRAPFRVWLTAFWRLCSLYDDFSFFLSVIFCSFKMLFSSLVHQIAQFPGIQRERFCLPPSLTRLKIRESPFPLVEVLRGLLPGASLESRALGLTATTSGIKVYSERREKSPSASWPPSARVSDLRQPLNSGLGGTVFLQICMLAS